MWAEIDRINSHYKNDHDVEVIGKHSWEFQEHVLIIFQISLGYMISKITHIL